MRRGILSLIAMLLSLPVLYGVIAGSHSLEAAAVRLLVLSVGVGVLDRYAAPLMGTLLRVLDPRNS